MSKNSHYLWSKSERSQFVSILSTARTPASGYSALRRAFPYRSDGSLSAELERTWRGKPKPTVVAGIYSMLWKKRSAAMKKREAEKTKQEVFPALTSVLPAAAVDKLPIPAPKWEVREVTDKTDHKGFLDTLGKIENLTNTAASLQIMDAEMASKVLDACETLKAFFVKFENV